MRPYIICLLILLFSTGSVQARQERIYISGPDGREAQIIRTPEGFYRYTEGKINYALEKDNKGAFIFKSGKITLASGGLKGDKFVMKDVKKKVFLTYHIKPGDIKFKPSPDSEWEFKNESDKIVVLSGGEEFGKIKFYPEHGKLKLKNRMDNPVVEIKGYPHLSSAPGVYLIEGLKPDITVCMVLLMLSTGK